MSKRHIAQILMLIAMLTSSISIWQTLAFSWDPLFRAPMLPEGPTHTNYHAFREACLAMGALSIMTVFVFGPSRLRTRSCLHITTLVAISYYVGWWLPWPLLGYTAPHLGATIVHLVATGTAAGALWLASIESPNGGKRERTDGRNK